MEAPIENLVRVFANPQACRLRAAAMPDDGDGPDDETGDDSDLTGNTLYGHFAVFNRWTEIDSWYEGQFMERIAPGAFADSFAARGLGIRILYDHGHDPAIGNKPIAAPTVFREDDIGAYYEGDILSSTYAQELKPALAAGQLGASFRFRVTGESWVDTSTPSDTNPKGLPERTITGIDVLEAGPVTFGAYDEATAGCRSSSDQFLERLLDDPLFLARFAERTSSRVVSQTLESAATHGHATPANVVAHGAAEVSAEIRRYVAALTERTFA